MRQTKNIAQKARPQQRIIIHMNRRFFLHYLKKLTHHLKNNTNEIKETVQIVYFINNTESKDEALIQ